MSETESKPNANKPIATVAAAVVVVGIVCAIIFWPRGGEEPETPKLKDPAKVAELRNRGLAHLEENQAAKAEGYFEQLVKLVPKEEPAWRNLAIARLMKTTALVGEITRRDEFEKELAGTIEAINKLEEVSDRFEPKLFRARLHSLNRDFKAAWESYQQAAKRAPKVAFIAYEMYRAGNDARDADIRAAAETALAKVYELDPSNLFSTPEYLQLLIRDKDKSAEEVFRKLRPLIEPYAEGLKRRSPRRDFDLLKDIDDGTKAVAAGDWETADEAAYNVGTMMRPTPIAQSDARRIKREHPLEYVAVEFRKEIEKQLVDKETQPSSIEVKLKPFSHQPQLAGARQVRFADIDLDERADLVVLTDDAVVVLADDGTAWKQVMTLPIADAAGFAVADLDFDSRENLGEKFVKGPDGKEWPEPSLPFFGKTTPIPQCTKADLDLIVFGKFGVKVFNNFWQRGTRKREWREATKDVGLPSDKPVGLVSATDVDADGDLDLVIAWEAGGIAVYRNVGEFQFTKYGGDIPVPTGFRARAMIPFDFDRDIDTDLIVFSNRGSGYLENLRHAEFRWVPLADVAAAHAGELVGTSRVDQWLIPTLSDDGLLVTPVHAAPDTPPKAKPAEKINANLASQIVALDLDNDGIEDLAMIADQKLLVLRGKADGSFEDFNLETEKLTAGLGELTSLDADDVDRDNDVDLVVAGKSGVRIIENDGGNQNKSLTLALRGAFQLRGEITQTARVNHFGIGSTVQLKSGRVFRQVPIRREHVRFGLGSEEADVVRVVWTNGIQQNSIDPKSNELVCAEQRVTGSCPFLYSWDGEKFAFVTDCLWASPLGLQAAEDVIMPHREWEYLSIPGRLLKPKNDEYVLQITEELWEAAYFDLVELLVVDRPADLEVFSNEKVGPPDLAKFKVHTVRKRRVPRSITGISQGKRTDLLDTLGKDDDRFAPAFSEIDRQGVVDDHLLEIDLGDVPDPKRVTLFLKAWMRPTGTSINVSLTQRKNGNSSKPPALQVADGNGGWKTVKPFMGFPGGKTKVIAVDLSDLFPAKDYRLRIATNMEFYWDAVWFTSGEETAETKIKTCDLKSAHLHFRGYSRMERHPHNGPHRYIYNDVETDDRWPPVGGKFTRFGDVTPLLKKKDAQQVIMGAGDEMTLRFAMPKEPPPPGWKRDFILHSVGWDKDFDLNTITGTTVGPLPFPGMRTYPYRRMPANLATDSFREYLRTYQTRSQSHRRFWNRFRTENK